MRDSSLKTEQNENTETYIDEQRSSILHRKGGDPAAPSDTATLLRLHPNHLSHLRRLAPKRLPHRLRVLQTRGVTGGVQGPGTYSPRHADPRLLAIPASVGELQPTIRTENGFMRLAPPRGLAALCTVHCSTCVAQVIRGMMI